MAHTCQIWCVEHAQGMHVIKTKRHFHTLIWEIKTEIKGYKTCNLVFTEIHLTAEELTTISQFLARKKIHMKDNNIKGCTFVVNLFWEDSDSCGFMKQLFHKATTKKKKKNSWRRSPEPWAAVLHFHCPTPRGGTSMDPTQTLRIFMKPDQLL